MTGAHPDHIRNQAEAVGDTFAKRVDRFAEDGSSGFGGPLFGMGLKRYDQNRTHTSEAGTGFDERVKAFEQTKQRAPNPFRGMAGSRLSQPPQHGPASSSAPLGGPTLRQQSDHRGVDFSERMKAVGQEKGKTPNPFRGMAGIRPTPSPHIAAPALDDAAAGRSVPPINSPAFAQYAENFGKDFARRVDQFARENNGTANPFDATGNPADHETRIHAARSEYRSMMNRLSSDLAASKEKAELESAREISVATGRNEAIGRSLDNLLRDIESNTLRQSSMLKRSIADMGRQLKNLARQMPPAQRFANESDSLSDRVPDGDILVGSDRFAALSQERNHIKERIAAAEDRLRRQSDETVSLRAELVRQAEVEIAANDAAIDRIKVNHVRTLEALDQGFSAARAFEMERIAATHGVAFGPERGRQLP